MDFNRPFQPANILGVRVSMVTLPLVLSLIEEWIRREEHQYICCTNTHLLTAGQSLPPLRRALNHAGLVTPDGMPLVWLGRWMGHPAIERVYGPDLLLAVCEKSTQMGWRHFFYGGAPGVANLLAQRMTARFPGLLVSGTCSPSFHPLSPEEDQAAIEQINAARPDIVWVGLGAPKQELWMAAHLGKISAPVMVGVGAAFDFHSGLKKQAPRWMQRGGLEWLFRLASEPRRLARRYLVNNPLFVWLVLLQLSGLRKFPIEQ